MGWRRGAAKAQRLTGAHASPEVQALVRSVSLGWRRFYAATTRLEHERRMSSGSVMVEAHSELDAARAAFYEQIGLLADQVNRELRGEASPG